MRRPNNISPFCQILDYALMMSMVRDLLHCVCCLGNFCQDNKPNTVGFAPLKKDGVVKEEPVVIIQYKQPFTYHQSEQDNQLAHIHLLCWLLQKKEILQYSENGEKIVQFMML